MSLADTVFVGGGTPTLVPPARPCGRDRRDSVPRTTPRSPSSAIPMTSPSTCWPRIAIAGVNRVSLGVQSMSAHVLSSLGRTHDQRNVERAVEAIQAVAMPSFNLDLIYGAVGESLDNWRSTVESALAFDPPHISAYGLTVEAGTPLAAQSDRHPDDDDQADKYELVDDLLAGAGLVNYEVSNWAKPGHESRHNFLYWNQDDYRGFGCAAHSHRSGRRWWNVRTPERYVQAIARGESVEASFETLGRRRQSLRASRTRVAHPRRGAAQCVLGRHARLARRHADRTPDGPGSGGAHAVRSTDGQRHRRSTSVTPHRHCLPELMDIGPGRWHAPVTVRINCS